MDIKFTKEDSANNGNKIAFLSTHKKDRREIERYYKEFVEIDRKQRDSQIGIVQKDKFVTKTDNNGNKKIVKVSANRVPVAFAKKIVQTSVTFEFGKPVKLTPLKENKLTEQVLLDWKNARLDHKFQIAKKAQKRETQSALLFYYKDLKPNNLINKVIGVNSNRAMNCRVLDFESGEFYPYFDNTGDMRFFVYQFQSEELDEKLLKTTKKDYCWIYSDALVYKLSRNGNDWTLDGTEKHGFGKIPVVYMSQPKPEHYDVKEAIDRIEVCISKLGASNDYSGHPILFLEGEVYGLPDKNADGKVMKTSVEIEEGKKVSGGDAKFLTHDNAPDSVKLEIEKLEDYIYTMTSTPNISFSSLKSIGNISGKALELMFLDSTLKKLMNEGQNRTDVERAINIIISGIITTSKVAYKSFVSESVFNIEFGNVLPNNFDEIVETVALAVQSGVMSKEVAIELIGEAENLEEELKRIKEQSVEKEPTAIE